MTVEPELLDRHEVALLLGISTRTVEYKAASGELPGFVRLFRSSARWRRSVLLEWISAGCPDVRQAPQCSAIPDSDIGDAADLP